jgi:hypothetical protein
MVVDKREHMMACFVSEVRKLYLSFIGPQTMYSVEIPFRFTLHFPWKLFIRQSHQVYVFAKNRVSKMMSNLNRLERGLGVSD